MKQSLTILLAGFLIASVSIFLIHPFTATAAVARVQVFSGTNTAFASTVTTSSVTVTAGNLIICTAEADVATSITMADSKGNAWSRIQTQNLPATFVLETWYAKATIGGSGYTVTATDNGGGVDSLIICEEWSGQDPTAPLDRFTGLTDTSITTNLTSGATAATTQANEIVIGTAVNSGSVTCTLGATYSNLTKVNSPFSTLCYESKIVSATGAQTATFTVSVAGSWITQVQTFKEAAAPPPPTSDQGHANATFTNWSSSVFTGPSTTVLP